MSDTETKQQQWQWQQDAASKAAAWLQGQKGEVRCKPVDSVNSEPLPAVHNLHRYVSTIRERSAANMDAASQILDILNRHPEFEEFLRLQELLQRV